MIHPTAIIDPQAEIGKDVTIGPFTIIGEEVIVGDGTTIGPHVVIDPYVTIGQNCQIYQYAAVGAPPQSVKFEGEKTYVKIGHNSVLRERLLTGHHLSTSQSRSQSGESRLDLPLFLL